MNLMLLFVFSERLSPSLVCLPWVYSRDQCEEESRHGERQRNVHVLMFRLFFWSSSFRSSCIKSQNGEPYGGVELCSLLSLALDMPYETFLHILIFFLLCRCLSLMPSMHSISWNSMTYGRSRRPPRYLHDRFKTTTMIRRAMH